MKQKKKKRSKKKRKKYVTSSVSDTSDEDEQDVKARLKDHANLARAAYQSSIDKVCNDIVWKNIFPYLS